VILLAAASFLGGVSEAAFLVTITRAAIAIADGASDVGVVAGHRYSVMAALLFAAVLIAVRLASALLTLSLSTAMSVTVGANVRKELADAYLSSSWASQQGEPAGHLQELLVAFGGSAGAVVSSVGMSMNGALNLAALLTVSLLVNPLATAVVAGTLTLLALVLAPLRKRIRARSETAMKAQMSFAESVSELGAMGMEMQVYGVREPFAARMRALIDRDAAARRRASVAMGALSPIYTTLAYTALLGGLGLASTVVSGELGGSAAVMLVMMRSLSYGQQLQSASAALLSQMPYLEILDQTVARYRNDRAPGGDVDIDKVGKVTFREVSFGYAPDQEVLHRLSFELGAGEVIGVVGPSGSGKSTLVQLLLGLREPTAGVIEVGGVDLRTVDRTSWTSRVALVAQEAILMSGPAGDNIAFFRPEITRSQVERSAHLAHVADDLLALRAGFETDVGQRGAQLSGGQRQRVSIARALAGEPELLVMDEPTSALDVHSEALIRQTIAEMDGVTVVIVAHRLSTLEVCDRILVLQHGLVRAFDTPQALAQGNTFYQEALALSGMTPGRI
jgi:ABC-type multidrug transport system fused ATPase/permease subunit